jgi:HAD superfamily hydrolase (TIGR01490 family)
MSPPVAAFFDMDLTLLSVNSAQLWLRYLWRKGELTPIDALRSASWLLRYKLALLDMAEISRKGLRGLAGRREDDLANEVADWYLREVKQHIYDDARALIEHHRAQGHRLVLLTGSSPYISRPITAELALDHYLCTHLEVRDGLFTGHTVEPVCYGHGKLQQAQAWADKEGFDLDLAWFYTDSYTDLPMLRRVGHPVATNPDPRLARLARREHIPTRHFQK